MASLESLERCAAAAAGPAEEEGAGLYAGYESWKKWDRPFTCSAEEAAYFSKETRGLGVRGCEVLEIGFGSGSFLAWARAQGARVAGTEINRASLLAAERAGVELLDCEIARAATAHANRFDTIVAFDVFEHFGFDEIVSRLDAVETMLKAGGRLVLRFPNAQSPFGLAPQNGDPTHRSALSRSTFEQLVQGRSLTIERYSAAATVVFGSPLRKAARLARGVGRRAVSVTLNFLYCQNIPFDPVVVLVLRKAPPPGLQNIAEI